MALVAIQRLCLQSTSVAAAAPAAAVALRFFASQPTANTPKQQQGDISRPRHTMNAKVVNATSDHLVSAVDPAPADSDLYSTSVLRDYNNYRKRTTSFGF